MKIMFEKFFPDEYLGSTYKIPFEKLYEQGYRGVIFDIDNMEYNIYMKRYGANR